MSAPARSPAARCAIAIYSSHGVSAIEVAKICFIAGLTFWLGNATVLGLGIFYAPEAASAINHLPAWFNRGLAGITIIVLTAYVIWVWMRPRAIGRDGWQVTLPGGPLTFLQIVIGIVDLGCCAAAMYLLLPEQPHISFVMLAVIFVSATLLGFASHSPGGLGVFDAAMLVALWQFRQGRSAGRACCCSGCLYYIIPFAFALAILGGREIIKGMFTNRFRRSATSTADVLVARGRTGQAAAAAASRCPEADRRRWIQKR